VAQYFRERPCLLIDTPHSVGILRTLARRERPLLAYRASASPAILFAVAAAGKPA